MMDHGMHCSHIAWVGEETEFQEDKEGARQDSAVARYPGSRHQGKVEGDSCLLPLQHPGRQPSAGGRGGTPHCRQGGKEEQNQS